MSVSIWEGTKAERVAAALESVADSIGELAPGKLETWAQFQGAVRHNRIRRYLSAGDQLSVNSGYTITASVGGSLSGTPTVVKDTFLAAVESATGTYVFTYDGAAWYHGGHAVTLASYGVSITGTPAADDTITVVVAAGAADYNAMGIDEETPVNSELEHVLTIQRDKIMGRINFDPPQYLFPVTAESLAALGITGSVLPAGTYNVTLNHGSYSNGTGEDGTYQFTTTVDIPIGGGIRHTTIGGWLSDSSGYVKSHVTGGTFITYGADTITTLETGLTTTEGSDGINLGTATARDPQYKSGDYINFTDRQIYGSNRWSTSYLRQLLNSDDAALAWKPGTIWSRNTSATPEGFLHTLDSELRAVLCKVRKRYALSISDGYGYEDVEDYVTLATMLDVFGSKNNNISEGPVDASGNLTRTTAYSYWQENNEQADRIKEDSAAYYWWLGSVGPSVGHHVRLVLPSGALSSGYASSAYGVVPSLHIA